MRELKFRAWLVPHRRSDGKPSKRNKPYYDYFDLGREYGDDTWFSGASVECFEQYTGLKDKNGKEIYEGDIIKYAWTRCNYIVVYRKYDTSFVLENDDREEIICFQYTQQTDYEVIGNIHENPELLEAE